jgi:SPP1 family predicted phage head-tail adaptor
MSLGQMDRLVTIQKAVETKDATSKAPRMTWSTLGTAYMWRRDARGRERFTADQLSAAGDTVWRTHFREDMDPEIIDVPKHRRLRYRGRTYEITSATHLGMRDGIELVPIASQRVTS